MSQERFVLKTGMKIRSIFGIGIIKELLLIQQRPGLYKACALTEINESSLASDKFLCAVEMDNILEVIEGEKSTKL